MAKLVKVADTKDVPPGAGKVVEVEGRTIALFNVAGAFCAIDNACSHVEGPLGEGDLTGDVVTCPWHGAKFNVKTGAVLAPPARTAVRSYPVQVQGDAVFVDVEGSKRCRIPRVPANAQTMTRQEGGFYGP